MYLVQNQETERMLGFQDMGKARQSPAKPGKAGR